eukprot:Blabericola_migrator_1__3978@NODE_2204_length_3128_cov_216_193074_g1388_i0_p1_GENE_NODE_2204_length_3128_cov_216_193074_g1388_i0NODE_2204_length_3128_cov_216_193074_g1388_i0_p1_ORF_typecomplete_len696_score77_29CLASP_N/PF12348_8/1_7e06CLASP_N/PF12348_8/0_054DUF3819/PF12842_7/8_7e03DUF3819/PF12842_7/0_17_NODE_2204_length_3128_cov_216_193074_g1388_i06912778
MSSPSKRVDIGGIDYPSWDTLTEPNINSRDDLIAAAAQLLQGLEPSSDWKLQFETLTEIQRISKYNSALLLMSLEEDDHLAGTCLIERVHEPLLTIVNSLRSALSKNAMLTVSAFIRGLGTKYLRTLCPAIHSPHGTNSNRHSPVRGSALKSPVAAPKLYAVVNLLMQKASSPSEKKFIQMTADETIGLFASAPYAAEPLLAVIVKIMKECKNSRVTGTCGESILKCWTAISSRWLEGKELGSLESISSLVSSSIPFLLLDKNAVSRRASRKLVEEMRATAESLDSSSTAHLDLMEASSMSQMLVSLWASLSASIASPSTRITVSKLLTSTGSESTSSSSFFPNPIQRPRSFVSRSPSHRRGSSKTSEVKSPLKRKIVKSPTPPSGLLQSAYFGKPAFLQSRTLALETRTTSRILPKHPSSRIESGNNSSASNFRADSGHHFSVSVSRPDTGHTFSVPTRSSLVPAWHRKSLSDQTRPVPSLTQAQAAAEISKLLMRSQKLPSRQSTGDSVSNASRKITHHSDVPRPTLDVPRPVIDTEPHIPLHRGTRGRDRVAPRSNFELPPRTKLMKAQKSFVSGREEPPLPVHSSVPWHATVEGLYSREGSGNLMEKSVTTTSTTVSSQEDRPFANSRLASSIQQSARDRSRSLTNGMKMLSSRRALSLNSRTGSRGCYRPQQGPPELPPWLLDDEGSIEP